MLASWRSCAGADGLYDGWSPIACSRQVAGQGCRCASTQRRRASHVTFTIFFNSKRETTVCASRYTFMARRICSPIAAPVRSSISRKAASWPGSIMKLNFCLGDIGVSILNITQLTSSGFFNPSCDYSRTTSVQAYELVDTIAGSVALGSAIRHSAKSSQCCTSCR